MACIIWNGCLQGGGWSATCANGIWQPPVPDHADSGTSPGCNSYTCPAADPVLVNNTLELVVLHPGCNCVFGPGNFTLNNTIELGAGQVICILGHAEAGKPSVLMPPRDMNATKGHLHFAMYGGGLFLTDIVISGAIDPEQPTATKGGGGIVVWKSRAEAADTADHATLVTERVTFT